MKKRATLIVLFTVLNFGALAIGSYLSGDGAISDWYQNLNKAPWTPPGWVFGAAWTFLMLCYSVFLIFEQENTANGTFFWGMYSLQWLFNVAWNPLFFKYHWSVIALGDLVLLALVIYLSLYRAVRWRSWKMALILPYAIWILLAVSLNAYIVLNNF